MSLAPHNFNGAFTQIGEDDDLHVRRHPAT